MTTVCSFTCSNYLEKVSIHYQPGSLQAQVQIQGEPLFRDPIQYEISADVNKVAQVLRSLPIESLMGLRGDNGSCSNGDKEALLESLLTSKTIFFQRQFNLLDKSSRTIDNLLSV